MQRTQVYLDDEVRSALIGIAHQTGKSQSQLLREAIAKYVKEFAPEDQRDSALKKARGLWKNRKDLPDFKRIRQEFDRGES